MSASSPSARAVSCPGVGFALEDFPAEVRDDVRDFSEVFVRVVDSRDEITAERVGQALRTGETVRAGDGFYATPRQAAVSEVLWERLRGTYDEFRGEGFAADGTVAS